MKKALKSILAALATATGADTETLAAKLADADDDTDVSEEISEVLDAHKKKVKDQKATDNSDGYKKAQKEVLAKLETDLKTKYGVTTDKTGTELVDVIVAAKAGDPAAVTEDVVKKSPAYLALESSVTSKIAEATKAADAKVAELEKTYTRRDQFQTVKAKALEEFDKLNPVLPTDTVAAQKRRDRFVKDLEQGTNFELTQAGDVLLLDADGKRREDAHGNPVKFSEHVKSLTDELGFEYMAATERSSSGNQPSASGNGNATEKKYKGELPAKGDEAKYMALLTDTKLTTEEKVEIQAAWTEVNK